MADSLNIKIGIDEPNYIKSIAGATAHFNSQFANKHKINLGVDSKGMSRSLGQITGNVKDFESSLAASNARVIAFGASTAIIGGVIRSFQELANATIEVEKSMIDVNRVFGLTSSGLQKLTSDLFEVSKVTASSFKDSSKALLEFSRQGVSAADALQRTKDALTLTRLAGVSTEAAVESLTATVNGFSNAGLTTTQVLNKLVAVEQNYAVGAGDLAEALARTGQAAQEAGVDLDQLNALVTSAQQNTARGGAVIGNALKTIFTRVQRAGTLEQLENFNVVVRDLEGNVLPAVQILRNFASVYKDLGTSQKSQLSEQIAGVYQVNILKALIKDLNSENSIYNSSLATGIGATNEAEIATAKLNSTMSALFSRVGTGTTQLASNIGNVTFEPLARSATTAVESILNVFNTALEGDGVGSFFANGLLKGIKNVLGGPVAVGLFAVLYKVASTSFTYLSEIIPKLIGITTETGKRRLLEENVLAIMQQQGSVANAILNAQGNQAAQAAIIVNEARLLTREYEMQVLLSKQLAPLLSRQGISVGKRGIEATRSGGFIPDSVRNAEIQGAFQGGYIPGKVIKSPVGGVMNSAEHVKYYAGFSQPFINPPANSKAGMAHKVNSIRKTGVNPYSNSGFVPNFAGGGVPNQNDFSLTGTKLVGQSGKFVSHQKIGQSISNYIRSLDLASLSNFQINNQIRSLIGNYKLNAASFAEVTKQSFAFAKAEKEARKQISSVKFGGQYGITDNVIFGGAVNRGFVEQNTSRFPLGNQPSLGIPVFSGTPNFGNKTFQGSVSGAIQSAGTPSFANKDIVSKILSQSIPDPNFARSSFSPLSSRWQGNQGPILSGGVMRSNPIVVESSSVLLKNGGPVEFSNLSNTGTVFGNARSGQQLRDGGVSGRISNFGFFRGGAGSSLGGNNLEVGGGGQSTSRTYSGGPSISSRDSARLAASVSALAGIQTSVAASVAANKKGINPNLGFGLMLGLPLLGGFVDQAAFGNKKRSELSGGERFGKSLAGFGVSSVATGAFVGSSFGSVGGIPGVALGAGAGALLALITAINDTSLSFEELVQKADEVKAKNAEIVSSGQAYINLLNQRNQLTDPEKINIASLNLVDAFYEIKDVKLQDAFRNAKEDVTGLTKALGDYDKKARLNTKREEQVVKIANLSKIAGSEKDIRALGFKKSVVTEKDRRSGQRPDFLSGQDPRNVGAAQAQVKTLLDDLSSVSDEVAFYLQRQLDFTEQFDADKISSLLNSQGVSDEDTIEVITKQMSGIFSGQGPISEFIRKNFARILIDFKGKAKAADSSGEAVIFAQNSFNQFKLRLNKSIFDELEQVNQAAKTFEFDQSIQTMVTEKMREIGDGMFSALLNNASELGQLSIKQSQLQFNSKIQSKQIEESLAKVQGETAGKRSVAEAKLQSDLVALIPQSISKSGSGIDQISTLLGQAKTGNLTDKNIQSSLNDMFNLPKDNFDYPSFGDSFVGIENQTQDLFLKFKSANNEFQGVVTALEREVEIEKIKANYARSVNELSFKTSELQLNTEKKRLAISIAQKEAINRLTAETGGAKIAGTTSLELEKIKQGGEFRYLGMNKKEEFVAQQADQQRIFQLEQSLEKDKIIAETRQSIIEIAAQNANTEALNENTRASLDAAKTFLELKIGDPSVSEQEKGSYRNLLEQNISNTQGFKSRNQFDKLNLFSKGENEYASIEKAIEDLKEKASKEGIDPNIKTSLEAQIIQLELAAKQLESSATIVAERSKQAASDFQRSSGFVNNMAIGFNQLSRSADDIVDKLGRDVPSMFADGISNAIARGITGAQKIGDALKDSAISFGQQIISDLLRASLYRTLGATGIGSLLGAKQKGGVITAQNGMYISGGRTGDKNMALLEDGEYVLNRNAVKAAGGKGVLDQFNFKQAPRFATGGGFGTQAEMKYLRPKGKDEGYDFTDNLLSGNTSQSINADNYSAYAYENDQYFVKKREQAVQDLAEKVQRDFVKKQKNAALISSIVGAVGAMSLSAGISQIGQQAALGSQAAQAAKSGSLIGTTPAAQKAISSLSDRQLGRFISNNSSDFRLNGLGLNFSAGTSNGFLGLSKLSNLSQPLTKAGFTSLKGSGFSLFNQGVSEGVGLSRRGRQDGGLIGLNGGGYLPHGSRLGDTIPALLTGGEYVMNNSAVKKYGIGKMNEMNNGSMNENSSSTTSNTNNNSANISISIDRSGKSVVGATNSSYEKQDLILTKDMARSIHAVVLKTMSNEKRYGGELYKNPLRS